MSSKNYQHGGSVMTGFVNSLQQHIATMDSPAKLLYGFVVVVMIVYSSLIPSEYRMFADSILGRIFGIAIVYGVVESVGWIYGLLTALAFLLVINQSYCINIAIRRVNYCQIKMVICIAF